MISSGISISSLIEQLPGYFSIKNMDSSYIFSNKKTARIFGFKSVDDLVGLTDYDLKCPSAEMADVFIKNDKLVLKRNQIKFLERIGYDNNDWKTLLCNKQVLKDMNNCIIGLSVHLTEITHDRIIDVSRFLFKNDKRYQLKSYKNQFSYQFEDNFFDYGLTERESECLFFILRGKTCKDIANIINLSQRTVESYINSIKNKLGCANKNSLIEKSLENGMLYVIPKRILNGHRFS